MSTRDELAEVIRSIDGPASLGGLEIADAILAAGYRKLEMSVAPLGFEVTAPMVQEVWDTFVTPGQSDDAPPQSGEMRTLMAILRGVCAALEEVK